MSFYLFTYVIMSFWPQKREITEIWITSLWALIAWVVGSILMFLLIILISRFFNIFDWFNAAWSWMWKTNVMFPLILSFVAFVAISFTSFTTYFFLYFANPERYKKNYVIFGQIAFFTFFSYLFFVWVYVYTGLIDYNYIIVVFLIHAILVIFWVNLIIEILNNYRYVLVSVYWSFVWLFLTLIITSFIFSFFETSSATLVALLFLLPLINTLQVLFKWIFDFIYYHYNRMTNLDQVWDIFYQIEMEEKQALREEEEKNSI